MLAGRDIGCPDSTAVFISTGGFRKKNLGRLGLNGPLVTVPSFFPTKNYLLNYLSFLKHISIGKNECNIFLLSEDLNAQDQLGVWRITCQFF